MRLLVAFYNGKIAIDNGINGYGVINNNIVLHGNYISSTRFNNWLEYCKKHRMPVIEVEVNELSYEEICRVLPELAL